jgi:hypothetical protein
MPKVSPIKWPLVAAAAICKWHQRMRRKPAFASEAARRGCERRSGVDQRIQLPRNATIVVLEIVMLSRMSLWLCLVLAPISAHADWQYATWGMSPEEVIAASKGVAVRVENSAVARNGERVLLTAPYTTNDILFVVHFWFAVGEPKLARVSLGTKYATDCPNVRSLLFSIYGAPQVSDLGPPSSLRWRSDATANFTAFTQYGDTRCVLDYYPIPMPGPPGL